MEKVSIKNRKVQKVVVLIEKNENPKGLAFVMHGLSGNKEQPHIAAFAEAFKNKGFTVVRFDTTNTYGESNGRYEKATFTNYYEDLEDVIAWAKTQDWYQEPFFLSGHSFGGMATIFFSENHPSEVKGLAPISSTISGKLSESSAKYKEIIEKWKRTGWREEKSKRAPGGIKKLPWSHMVDRLKYNMLPRADKLTMPVLIVVGELDEGTPPEHQQLLYEKIPGKKEFHIIKGAHHDFITPEELQEIQEIMEKWIDKHLNS